MKISACEHVPSASGVVTGFVKLSSTPCDIQDAVFRLGKKDTLDQDALGFM
jgi:hypothetical protein